VLGLAVSLAAVPCVWATSTIYLYIYISLYLYSYTPIYLCTCIPIHLYTLSPYIYSQTLRGVGLYLHISLSTRMPIYVPICIHVCMYMSPMCRYTCGSIGCVLARERACYLSCALAHVCWCLHFCVHVSVWLPACSPARPVCLHFCVHVSVWLPACSPARLTNARAVRYRLLAASAPSAPACPEPRQYMRQCVHETVRCYCSSLCPQCICLLGALNMRQCGATAAAYALNASALLGALKGIRPGPVFNPTGMGLVPIRQARDSAGAYSNPGQKIMPGA
jgi:hypothetical protein